MKNSNFWEETNGVFEISLGAGISATIAEGITIAAKLGRTVVFEFNGVMVSVNASSDAALIYRDWSRALSGYINKAVGPDPSPQLTSAELVHDAEVEAANEARRAASQAEYDRKARAKKAATDARLALAPPMALRDADAWQKSCDANKDGYGGAVVTYANQWARLMQLDLANGAQLQDIAEATSREADTDGITGFMYGCAVSMLAQCWQHGEELRRWHNSTRRSAPKARRPTPAAAC